MKELDLFKILPNGDPVGSLVPYLNGFINWILSCPPLKEESIDFLYQGGSNITQLISQDSIHVNPLHVFVKDCLVNSEKDSDWIRIGNSSTDSNTLYWYYCKWCTLNGIKPMSPKSFSILLLDQLKQLG